MKFDIMKFEVKFTVSFEAPGFCYNDVDEAADILANYTIPQSFAVETTAEKESIKTNYEITIKRKER